MRDVDRVAQRIVSCLTEPELQQRRGASRYLQAVQDRLVRRVDQFRACSVRGHAEGAGVRDAHRDAVHADRDADVELLDQGADGGDEEFPLAVRFQAVQEEELHAGGVRHQVEVQGRGLVVLPVVLVVGHRGAAGAVVDQAVDVEGGHDAVLELVQEVLGDQAARAAGVHEALQLVQQDHAVQAWGARRELVQSLRISARDHCSPTIRSACWLRRCWRLHQRNHQRRVDGDLFLHGVTMPTVWDGWTDARGSARGGRAPQAAEGRMRPA